MEMENVITVPIDWKSDGRESDGIAWRGRRVKYFEVPVTLPEDRAVYLLGYSLTLSRSVLSVELVRRPQNDPPESMAANCIADLGLDRLCAPRGERIEKTYSPPNFLSSHVEEYGNAEMSIPLAVRVFTDFTHEKGQVIKGSVTIGIAYHKDHHKPVPLPPQPPKTLSLAFERIERLEAAVEKLQAAGGGQL